MSKQRTGLAGKVALGASAALLAVALPTAGLAFGPLTSDAAEAEAPGFVAFTPADADPRLAQFVAERGGEARMMRFTPAGISSSQQARTITVAVRVDQQTADVLSALGAPRGESRAEPLQITPTRYNLGLARGYNSFAQASVAAAPAPASTISRNLSAADIPDLAEFTPSRGVREEPSRFVARVALDEDTESNNRAVSGERLADQLLDVGGSYSLTRNLDITAGVRYEQDRDLRPVPNLDQQDSQAVYIGTQFRF